MNLLKITLEKKSKIALAGGVFSNVKINQKISELKNIKEIFIYPNMGDGGLAVGCAILSHNKHKKFFLEKLKTCIWVQNFQIHLY